MVTSERRKWLALALLCVVQFMVVLDIAIVNVALPSIKVDLGFSQENLQWVISAYALFFGGFLLLGGRAADLLGRRRIFFAGLVVFTVSSFASALAAGASMLFAARAGPGAGAAIGVLLGGVLTEVADWRAIFYINLPVGLALAVAATKVVPADSARPRWRGLDLRGAALATFSLAAIMYAISQAGSAGWASAQTLGLGVAGLAGLAGFVVLERGTKQPLLRVQRLTERAVGGGFLLMLVASAVLFGMFLLSSLYLQNVLGTGPLETGLAFLPIAIAAGLGAHVGSQLVSRMG